MASTQKNGAWPLTGRRVIEACGHTSILCGHTGTLCGHTGTSAGAASSDPWLDGVPVTGISANLTELESGDLFVALSFVDADAHDWVAEALSRGAAMALVAESWAGLAGLTAEQARRCVRVPDVLAAFRKLAALLRAELSCPVVAIAGSNGKTTTKEMLAAMLSGPGQHVVKTPGTDNGFVGLPRTLCARELSGGSLPRAVVLEIGIDAPGAMAEHARMVAPDLALITTLGDEHLDGLGDVATAVAEELRLFDEAPAARRVLDLGDPEIRRRPALLRAGDVAVISQEEWQSGGVTVPAGAGALVARAVSHGIASELFARWFPGGVEARGNGSGGVEASGSGPGEVEARGNGSGNVEARGNGSGEVEARGNEPGGERGRAAWEGSLLVPMPGLHNARNAALALAAALALGRTPGEVLAGWGGFEPPPWRSHLVRLARGAILCDDCFNASPLSLDAALAWLRDPAWLGRPKLIVLGDMRELGANSLQWHLRLADSIAAIEGARLYLFGPAMCALGERLRAAGHGGQVIGAISHGDPAELIRDLELPERAVVLVKGSRAMRLERVSRALERRWGEEVSPATLAPSAPATVIAVTGSYGVEATARSLAAALRGLDPRVICSGPAGVFAADELAPPLPAGSWPELLRSCVARGARLAITVVEHSATLLFAAHGEPAVVVFTGLSEADLPAGGDIESHLAQKAQLFVRCRGLRVAVLNADDPASELLAEVMPPGVRVLRYGSLAARGEVDLRATGIRPGPAGACVTLVGSAQFPTSITLSTAHSGAVSAALAALLVVLALGGSTHEAAAHLRAERDGFEEGPR